MHLGFSATHLVWALASLLAAVALSSLVRLKRSKLPRPPAALSLPFIGDSLRFNSSPVDLARERHEKYGQVYSNVIMGQKFIQIGNPQTVKKLITAPTSTLEVATPLSFKLMLGEGSFPATHGEAHAALRKLMAPAFTPKAIAGYLPRIQAILSGYIDEWISLGHVSAAEELTSLTYKVAVEVILGFDDGCWFAAGKRQEVQENWQNLVVGLFAVPFWFLKYIPGTALHAGLKARDYFVKLTGESLDLLQEKLNSAGPEKEKESANVGQGVLSQTDVDGKPMSREKQIDACINILFAGHETTAKSMQMLMLSLKQYPSELAALREEQEKIVAKHGAEITEDAMKDMEYADACAREILRLYPIVGNVIRDAKEDFEVEGYQILKGDCLWLSLRRATREKNHRWEHSEKFPVDEFRPKRWFTEEARGGGGLMTFGGGSRLCVGMNLAFTELKMLMALLTRKCEYEVNVNERLVHFPIVRPADGLPMKVIAKSRPLVSGARQVEAQV